MTKTIIFTVTLTLTYIFCQGQSEKAKTEKVTKDAIKEWFENPSIENGVLYPKTIEQFQDTGRLENGQKEGLWIEYSLDSSLIEQTATLVVGDKEIPMTFDGVMQKNTGIYSKGKREGIWTTYESRDKKAPFYWNRIVVISYKYGKKHGEEINYQGYREEYQNPVLIRHWENGIEHGIGEIYDRNHPYSLQQVYVVIDSQMWLLEKYFPNGQLNIKFTDTIIAGQELKYLQAYYENGNIKQTGYYINGKDKFNKWINYYENGQIESTVYYLNGKLNGLYQYYHVNGQLWTERTYKDGKLWNVSSNFDMKGKKKDKGTIKDGTGTLKMYNKEGKLTAAIEYKNGQEIN